MQPRRLLYEIFAMMAIIAVVVRNNIRIVDVGNSGITVTVPFSPVTGIWILSVSRRIGSVILMSVVPGANAVKFIINKAPLPVAPCFGTAMLVDEISGSSPGHGTPRNKVGLGGWNGPSPMSPVLVMFKTEAFHVSLIFQDQRSVTSVIFTLI